MMCEEEKMKYMTVGDAARYLLGRGDEQTGEGGSAASMGFCWLMAVTFFSCGFVLGRLVF
jgi:hypothetical protein